MEGELWVGAVVDSALASDIDQGYDQHSSEEELEVINCSPPKHSGQEKRKWSQVNYSILFCFKLRINN